MIKRLYKKANQIRKQAYLNSSMFKAKKTYAFIGFGMHSLSNLYPILIHFGIQLKYICTRESSVSGSAQHHFPRSEFITDINLVLRDEEITGVFVSADPSMHFQLLTSLLQAGKNVFVEKPPCSDGIELNKLINISKNACIKVGLQRRYWPGNKYLLKNIGNARSYIYQFYFGLYPQGNVFNELFIHAIDYCIFLFGEFSVLSTSHQKYNGGITTQMHVKHTNGVLGLLELSTHYSWSDPVDCLVIHCVDELLEVKYPIGVDGRLKPKRILNLPAERILNKPIVSRKYFSVNNMIIPGMDINTLVLQGFYDELKTFIDLVENGHNTGAGNDLIGLQPVYQVLDELNKGI